MDFRYRANKAYESLLRKIVWRLPRRIVYWAYIRVAANAATGQYSNTVVPEITMMEALKRWDED